MGGGNDDGGLDVKRWNTLYPNYINSKKTVQEGRRIGLANCVEHPHPAEMAKVCEFLKIPHVLEMDKAYPRALKVWSDSPMPEELLVLF